MYELLQGVRLVLVGVFFCLGGAEFWFYRFRRDRLHLYGSLAAILICLFVVGRYLSESATNSDIVLFALKAQYATAALAVAVMVRTLAFVSGGASRGLSALAIYSVSFAALSMVDGVVIIPEVVPRRGALLGPTAALSPSGAVLLTLLILLLFALSLYMWRRYESLGHGKLFRTISAAGALVLVSGVNDSLAAAGLISSVYTLDFAVAGIGIAMTAVMASYTSQAFEALEQDVEARTQALEETVEGLDDLLKGLPDLVWLVRNDRAEPFSADARARWGADPICLTALGATPSDADRLIGLRDLEAGQDVALRIHLKDRDGAFPAEVISVSVAISGERVIVSSARDLSDREEIERRLRVNDRMASVGTLAAGVAHEINNPMTYIASNVAFVKDWVGQQDQGEEYLAALDDAAHGVARVAAIVRELRHFGGPDRAPSRTTSQLGEALEFAVRLTKPTLRHKCVVTLNLGEAPPPVVRGDEGRLSQVFINLLTNAADAMPPERSPGENRIVISSTVRENDVEVRFEDNGIGMSEDQLVHVFDPFFTTKRAGHGMGLGLSICHKIVKEVGGSLEIESTLGRGTTIVVRLTRDVAVHRISALTPIARFDSGLRLLLVDDEPQVLRALERVLSSEFDITTVGAAVDAIALLEAGAEFDAIFCDLMMPDMNGREFLQWLHKRNAALTRRFAIVTGGAVGEENREFLEDAQVPVLRKPLMRKSVRLQMEAFRSV